MQSVNVRSILNVFATMALGLASFGMTGATIARAAEIKVLCAVALHPAFDELIPDFEKSSGHKVTVATEMRALSRIVLKRVRPPTL